ncbi:carbohydrate ABC transporter permease [Lederbergia galactosidilytica]|uniref:Sugar ABC transporter permease n=1 Tax=Lederbergia galactosidilytica TaxID=217031 RepID=A0A0Q9XTU5_9BACI|nr:carbohydrate ABC transporter permease [Lederbergia galactosidilytica]KRG11654.1 sugar ABC transporter permease [Lederbergia galactosidilytica]KRG14394.1 sugar ABC transporter permease [Virgibacillus soli]MBP1916722.1 putative aldouronate transport system permease protein [Lederbergia galactosidilytica]OAK70971.1 sugar ABC transporter permease [Lederbergia galactosidilytica]
MVKESFGDRLFGVFVYGILSIVAIIVIYPLIYVLSASFSDPSAILKGEIWLFPKGFTFDSYIKVFQNDKILIGYRNTIFYTVFGVIINLLLSIMIAYPLSRRDFAGRSLITIFLVFTMFFSGGMIPTYLLIKDLGMLNTIWAVIIPGAVSVYNVIIIRTFFQSIPEELRESAEIDGCTTMQYLIKILLPLSKPIIAVMVLFYGVGHWNAFFDALIYLTDQSKFPLQLFLRDMLIKEDMSDMAQVTDDTVARYLMQIEGIKYSVVIVASLPMLILYPFLQKYFVKGVMIGALKG